MKIINETKKITIAQEVITPESLLDQSLGLLKYKKPHAMLLKTHFGIHTFGMKYAIDVLILDSQNKVITVKKNLQPNNIFLWNPKYETVLELPAGTLSKTKTEKGNIIKFL